MITGHCLCGFVRYAYDGEPGPASYCHCADCRRCTGSAFGIGVRLERAKLRFIGDGEPLGYTKQADSGHPITRHFCPRCGSPVCTSSPRHPDIVFAKAGLLDDPSVVRPSHQAWVDSRVPWCAIDPALPAYARARPPTT